MKAGWFAHPVVSAMIALAWLLLQQSVAPAQLITAVVLALAIPRLVHGFLAEPMHPRAWGTVLRLTLRVLWDIVVANMTVAKIVLWPWSDPNPAWVRVPLAVQHPTAITLLASIITMTPGTVSCVIDERRGEILVHVLDCDDGAAIVADIKARYEAPLKEILG